MKNSPNALKFSTQSRWSSLIINMIFEIADRDLKLKLGQIWSQNCNAHDFYEIWQPEQIGHANYECINWNWWPWPKTKNLQNLVPKVKRAPVFFEILHLQQFEHVDYKYSTWNWWPWPKIIDSGKFGPNTDICSNFHKIRHDYRLRTIVGSEHGTIMRTTIVTVIVPWSKWL